MSDRWTGLVLSAGKSTRMGAFKPLLPFGNVTVVERVVITLLAARLSSVSIVLGYRAEDIKSVLEPYPVETIVNADSDGDMLSSIQCGLRGTSPDSNILVALGDQPLIPVSAISQILAVASVQPDSLIVPVYQTKRGHPIVLPCRYRAEILALAGAGGLRQLHQRHPDAIIEVPVETDAVVLDLDFQQDYRNALQRINA